MQSFIKHNRDSDISSKVDSGFYSYYSWFFPTEITVTWTIKNRISAPILRVGDSGLRSILWSRNAPF